MQILGRKLGGNINKGHDNINIQAWCVLTNEITNLPKLYSVAFCNMYYIFECLLKYIVLPNGLWHFFSHSENIPHNRHVKISRNLIWQTNWGLGSCMWSKMKCLFCKAFGFLLSLRQDLDRWINKTKTLNFHSEIKEKLFICTRIMGTPCL